jgi:hypothetical protein
LLGPERREVDATLEANRRKVTGWRPPTMASTIPGARRASGSTLLISFGATPWRLKNSLSDRAALVRSSSKKVGLDLDPRDQFREQGALAG